MGIGWPAGPDIPREPGWPAPWPNGDRPGAGAARAGPVAVGGEPTVPEERDAWGTAGREVTGGRELGVVTPGITSIGRT
jgi:hypothetical protein